MEENQYPALHITLYQLVILEYIHWQLLNEPNNEIMAIAIALEKVANMSVDSTQCLIFGYTLLWNHDLECCCILFKLFRLFTE